MKLGNHLFASTKIQVLFMQESSKDTKSMGIFYLILFMYLF